MCGRYHIKDTDELTRHLRDTFGIPDWVIDRNRFNVAPSQILPIVATDEAGAPRLTTMRWGMVPFWDKSEKPKIAPINARSEEAFTKGMFRQSIQKRRCLIPADGFFEWQKREDGTKQPFEIHLRGGQPFFFPGIYESATELRPETFLLFTTRPNELMAPIHNRMPAILTGAAARGWLAPAQITPDAFTAFTEPRPSSEMEAVPVSSLVNNPRNDSPDVLVPLG